MENEDDRWAAHFDEIIALTDEELEQRLTDVENQMAEYHIAPNAEVFMGVKIDSTVDLLTELGIFKKDEADRAFRRRLLQTFEQNVAHMIPMIEEARRQELRRRIVPGNGRIDPLA